MCLYMCVFQEAEENKGATSWPEYYIDQLRSMAAVSNTLKSDTMHMAMLTELISSETFYTQRL